MSEVEQRISANGGVVKDVIQVTGDYYQIFGSPSRLLKSAIRSQEFGALFEDRIRSLVGREYLFQSVSRMVSSDPEASGYVLIRGQPGIGKTTLICMLLKRWGCVHHFNIVHQNIRSIRVFLENVCAQVIVRYGLNYQALPEDAGRDSGFLSHVLREASAKVAEPLVVLVDALDEAEEPANSGANRLLLPPSLPGRVHIIITTREQVDYRLEVDRRQDLHINNTDPENLADVRAYITSELTKNPERFEAAFTAWKVDTGGFVDLLTEHSEGNFMYLRHVLADIRDGRITPAKISSVDDLPRGLRDYYQRHWRQMRHMDRERFDTLFEPALRLLATAREPVGLDTLSEWSQASPARLREVIESWRPFLTESAIVGEKRYAIYHASFRDFLAQEGAGLQSSHLRIAEAALAKIGLRPVDGADHS